MPRFKKVYIEITNICNLSCKFCPKTKRKLKFMDEETFTHIIKEVKNYTEHVYFHLMGEPFLNKNVIKFLDICKENGLKVNITTNGTLINTVKDQLIKSEALRQVNISLHSFEANDQGVDFEEYINDTLDFTIEATEKSNIICALRLWNLDAEELKADNKLNTNILSIIEKKLNLDFSLREKLLENHRMKLRKNIYLNMAEKFQWPSISIEPINDTAFCYGLRDQIGVLVDGTVVPCCLDSEGNIPLGNLLENNLDTIINSKRAEDIYYGFSRRIAVEDLCKRCGYVQRNNK